MRVNKKLEIGSHNLTTQDVNDVVEHGAKVDLSPDALKRVADCHAFLQTFSKGKLIYGINTGFGPMAQYKINDSDLIQLQYNLIRSHCSGTGAYLPPKVVRSVLLARLNSLMQGYSGVHPELVHLLATLINKEVYPCIFEHGGVGASGDLVQLAHVALTLIGEGKVWYEDEVQETADVFARLDIQPIRIHLREGIAVLNGTSTMTGIGLLNILDTRALINWSVTLSSIINEIVEAFDDHFSQTLNQLKPHAGQQLIAAAMRRITSGSALIKKRNDILYQSSHIDKQSILIEKVQEYYSLRCVPQILGPILDTLTTAESVVVSELNSVNDNPIISPEENDVFHGGNFHGDYVALEMDKLRIAVTKLAMLSERQLNYLLNDKLNQKLSPFLNLGVLGLNYGMQGMQFTATSTTAECQTLATPMYIHSIPNNNDNQDVVSMGTNSALLTRRVIDNAFQILSIHAIAIAQAIDNLQCADRLSPIARDVYTQIRTHCPVFKTDETRYESIQAMNGYLRQANLTFI